MATNNIKCLKCKYYKTRVFRDPDELFNKFLLFTQCNKSYLNRAQKLIKDVGQVQVYWCDNFKRGPYLEIKQIMKYCKKMSI